MAEFLGKPKITKQDISGYMRELNVIVSYFLDEMKPKLHLSLDHQLFEQLERAVIKRYGSFSPGNLRRAALEALEEWARRNS